MSVYKTFAQIAAAAAIFSMAAAPVALADERHRGDRGDYRGDYRGDRGDRRDDRGDYRRDRDHRSDYRRDRDYRGDYRRDRRYDYKRDSRGDHYRYPARSYRHVPPPPPRYAYRAPPRHYYSRYGYAPGRYYRPGYRPHYSIGGWYSRHSHTVVIHDYAYYGLYPPPPGYYWVHDRGNGDAVLASMATGAIIGLVVGALVYN